MGSHQERLASISDGLVILVAVVLPWSVTAASISIVLWLLAVTPTIRWRDLLAMSAQPAIAMPALLSLVAFAGVTWSEASASDLFGNLKVYVRILLIAILFVQFQRSRCAHLVMGGFVASCALLMLLSWIGWMVPAIGWPMRIAGVPVKDTIIQSGEFLICAFALGHMALDAHAAGRRYRSVFLAALALLFLANIAYVATARSTVVASIILCGMFIMQRCGSRRVGVGLLAAIIGLGAWTTSSYLRDRVLGVAQEVSDYRSHRLDTSSGFRLEFWTRSIEIISRAPIVGHGTGSQREQFQRTAAIGKNDITAVVTDNPHNQLLYVAIQLGAIGAILLFATWFAHLMLFRGEGWICWVGSAVVVQSIVAGLFNTSLVEFTHSWMYIFGVGVLGGALLADRANTVPVRDQESG